MVLLTPGLDGWEFIFFLDFLNFSCFNKFSASKQKKDKIIELFKLQRILSADRKLCEERKFKLFKVSEKLSATAELLYSKRQFCMYVKDCQFQSSLPFSFLLASSMTSWTPYSSHLQLLRWLSLFSWTTHSITRTVPETEACHGGLNSAHSKETLGMRNSIPSLSTSTVSSRHHEVLSHYRRLSFLEMTW